MLYKNVTKYKEDKMGFFKDFKRDFAQAVNELMPDKEELTNEYDDEDMVNTFDENDNMDIAPEDMLEDLDDYTIDDKVVNTMDDEVERPETDYEDTADDEEEDVFEKVPEAEILAEQNNLPVDESEDELFVQSVVSELLNSEQTLDTDYSTEPEDELVELDSLDEKNMLEGIEEAMLLDGDSDVLQDTILSADLKDIDLNKAVEAALNPRQNDAEEDNMADVEMKSEEIDNIVKDKEQEVESILTDDTTYITKGTVIKGDIETDGGIDIIGEVQGNVTCEGKLIVGGSIKGNVKAGEIYANAAKIEGEITTEGSVKIGVGSVVMGNIAANSAVVAGAVNGDIDVHGPVIVDSTAVIMGNIKSRSVQINNGAVIEGFCSQCYSEIDVKSFFE